MEEDVRSGLLSLEDVDGRFQNRRILEQGLRSGLTKHLEKAGAGHCMMLQMTDKGGEYC